MIGVDSANYFELFDLQLKFFFLQGASDTTPVPKR